MRNALNRRLPSFSSLVSVYSVIVTLICGWTTVVFLWKLPSWLLILNVGEVLAAFSYVMAWAMVESLLLLGLITIICLLPAVWSTQENFVIRGAWFALGGYGSLMLIVKFHELFGDAFDRYWGWASLAGLSLTILLAVYSPRVRFLRTGALWIADRLQVFLFILVPVFFLSFLNVILRNMS